MRISILLISFLLLGVARSWGQDLHTATSCGTDGASTQLSIQRGGQYEWGTPGSLVHVFTDVGFPGQTVTFTVSGNTASLINSPGTGTPTPCVDNFSNSYTDALAFMTSGIGIGNEISVLVEFNPPVPGDVGFDFYHVNKNGSGDYVTATANTIYGGGVNPTFVTPAAPSYTLVGPNGADAYTFTTVDDGQLGVNFSSPDSIASISISWQDCIGCPTANHGLGIGNFEFCRRFLDNDGDGVEDHIDVDDDNDGIPDVTETCAVPFSNPDQDTIDVEITLDGYPDETTWRLVDDQFNVLASGGPYANPADIGRTITRQVIIDADVNTTFSIYDSYGDALTWSPAGNYRIRRNGAVIIGPVASNWGSSRSESIPALAPPFDGFACIGSDYAYDDDDDGRLNYMDPDFCTLNAHGVCAVLDLDGDGIIDAFDTDADNDGILDAIEAQGSACYIAPNSTVDANGLPTNFVSYVNCADNSTATTYGIIPNEDSDDADNVPDYRDLDTDGDGIADFAEGFDHNLSGASVDDYLALASGFSGTNGSVAVYDNGLDSDGDGIPDWLDNQPLVAGIDHGLLPPFQTPGSPYFFDTDADGIVDLFDLDNGGSVPAYPSDLDVDGDPDWRDLDNNTSLPVEIVSFEAHWDIDEQAVLTWVVAGESGLSHYEVERSLDGSNFQMIGEQTAVASGRSAYRYGFSDPEARELRGDAVYYRLRIQEKNGQSRYSEVRRLNLLETRGLSVVAFPNPCTDRLRVQVSGVEGAVELELYDVLGSALNKQELMVSEYAEITMVVRDLPAGVYHLVVRWQGQSRSLRLMKN